MDRDPDTVDVTLYDCERCGISMTPAYHGDGCDATVVHVGSQRRCSGCGATISRPQPKRFSECGGRAPPSRFAAPLDLSPSVSPQQVERAIHEVTNRSRTGRNCSTLSYSDHLSAIALQHSRDMATQGYFAHRSPDGNGPDDRYRDYDHSDQSYGENIACQHPGPMMSSAELAERIVGNWMESVGHRENILEDQFEAEGIGVYITTDGTVYATQNFT
jgi:uncharacterized protein YkwD